MFRLKTFNSLFVSIVVLLAVGQDYDVIAESRANDTIGINLPYTHLSNRELLEYADGFRNRSIDSALLYTQFVYQRASDDDSIPDQIDALIQLGELNLQSGNTELAYGQIDKLIALGEETNSHELKAKVNMGLGRIAYVEAEYKSCLEYYFTALTYAEQSKNHPYTAEIYNKIAVVYFILNDYENAHYYLQKSFISGFTKKNQNFLQFLLMSGDIYLEEGQLDSAIVCYQRAKNLVEETQGNYSNLGTVYASLAKYYITINNLIEAENNCMLSIQNFELDNSIERMAAIYTYLAHIYSLQNDYRNTLKYNKLALLKREQVGVYSLVISSLNNVGGNFTELGEKDSALLYFNRALSIENRNKSVFYEAGIYKNMYLLYLKTGENQNALKYYSLYRDFNDSVLMSKNNKAITQMRIKYDLEKEKSKFTAFELSKSRTMMFILISFSLVLIFVLLLLLKKIREKRQDNKLLQEKNKTIQVQNQQLDKALSELKTSEQKYRTLSNNLPGLIFRLIMVPVEYMIFYNKLLLQLTGYTDEVLSEKYGNSLNQMILPDDLITLQEARKKAIAENKPYNIIYRFVQQGSALKYFNEIGIPIHDPSSQHTMIDGLIFDVTDKKITEHELMIALEKAQESDRLKSTFLSTLSHELRTPLNAIIGFSNIIDETTPIPKVFDYLSIIKRSGDHLLELVEDLFDISLIETNNISTHMTVGNLADTMKMIDSIIRNEQVKLSKSHVTINLKLPEDASLKINTDLRKLKQILINLLKNALKFTPAGTIDYGFKLDKQGDKTYYRFFVKDTGIGIQANKLSFIFDVFRQADDSHTRQYEGAGIGLSVVKRYVELLGGRIWVDTAFGEGSAFYFTLSADSHGQEPTDYVDFVSPNDMVQSSKTILIVEDITSAHALLKILLEKEGFRTIWAKNGQEAVEFCHTIPEIKLVLMDLKMPDMSGFVATRIIKEDFPNLPIIAQTAYAVEGDRQQALEAGFDDYIEKPIQKNKLLRLVYQYLSKTD
ncbi:MAG: ATP-binding protein [Bacteroidales bacterium]|nr:ATP-binding protein [Bacteroidales bacterium]